MSLAPAYNHGKTEGDFMDLQLTGKSALITGSTAGIGLAISTLLAKEGASVVVNGRSRGRVDKAVGGILNLKPKGEVSGIEADVGSADGVAKLTKELAHVDILVNNAGIFEPKPFEAISDGDWEKFFQVNVMSGVRLSRFYLPKMLKKNWGRIVFISSESALQIPAEMIHYGMTKTAQLAISRGLAETTAGSGVTVNSVLPGPTASEGVEQFVEQLAKHNNQSAKEFEKEFFKSARPSSLLKRFATSEEVANMVAYVCSPLSAATNGASLRCDGGVVRSIA
jgi:NAD(P)-dependent dehydrogenase (short-subunit alcohol dehydrogenase family)